MTLEQSKARAYDLSLRIYAMQQQLQQLQQEIFQTEVAERKVIETDKKIEE